MKRIRRILAVCLCLMLITTSSIASAAVSKTFTKVPTLKISFAKNIETDDTKSLTITASAPGFLTLKLMTSTGSLVRSIAENLEIRSQGNTYDFTAQDIEGNPLIPGEYMFIASMVNQFGVSSKEITLPFTVREMSEETLKAAAERAAALAAAQAAASKGASSASAAQADSSSAAKSSTSKTSTSKAAAATPLPTNITYVAGNYVMGDEGLQIGVGVPDVATQENSGYWALTPASSDAELWAALTKTMTAVDVDEQESAYIYDSPKEGRRKLGTVSGFSQGLNLIVERTDGWSLVEAFRNEDGAFVRGYIRSNKLRSVEPDQNYGVVIDKASQLLIVFKDGQRVGSVPVCTGLATTKYPHRETPAGEFVLATRRGTLEYYGQGYSKYTIRINGSYYLSEIPTTKKNGTNFSILENVLGSKATRGNICIAHDASTDGSINAEWIWSMTDGRKRVKLLIFDDKPRTDVPATK
ncbi:MAG: L,D-transpeptidase [Clostridia bacterium]|nr:L,D-transpeptidase [Clostridia bacterium]